MTKPEMNPAACNCKECNVCMMQLAFTGVRPPDLKSQELPEPQSEEQPKPARKPKPKKEPKPAKVLPVVNDLFGELF